MIHAEKTNFPVTFMCKRLGVSPSGYYAWTKRQVSKRKLEDERLTEMIRKIHRESRGTYGSPRIHDELVNEHDETVSRHRVARLMRENNITAKPLKRFRKTTDSKHDLPIAPNLLERDFTADAPNRVWVGDVTYLWTARGWMYLAVILDLFSRKVVGWSLADHMRTELVLSALEQAVNQRGVSPDGLIYHSDRGVQYASKDYRAALSKNGITPSMSRKGNCWDNAVAESFFSTLKRELVHKCYWTSEKATRIAIHDYIEVFYNRKRKHSTIGNLSPVEFERRLQCHTYVAA